MYRFSPTRFDLPLNSFLLELFGSKTHPAKVTSQLLCLLYIIHKLISPLKAYLCALLQLTIKSVCLPSCELELGSVERQITEPQRCAGEPEREINISTQTVHAPHHHATVSPYPRLA